MHLPSGAQIFRLIERNHESDLRQAKQEKAEEVDESQKYMSTAFYWYVHDDKYNYTENVFHETVQKRLNEFITFVVKAAEDVSYDGTIDGWDERWTFPNALLFTISIMTLIGESTPLKHISFVKCCTLL